MSTTELFVELIVIGLGCTIWMFLLVLSIFGTSWVDFERLLSLPTLIPFLAFTYVLGIIFDRLADLLFEVTWGKKICKQYYDHKTDFHNDRRLIYIHQGRLADFLEYGRSRLRICRGWVINLVLILFMLNLFAWTQIATLNLRIQISTLGSFFCILLIAGAWFSWYTLTLNDFRRVKEQSQYLRQLQSH